MFNIKQRIGINLILFSLIALSLTFAFISAPPPDGVSIPPLVLLPLFLVVLMFHYLRWKFMHGYFYEYYEGEKDHNNDYDDEWFLKIHGFSDCDNHTIVKVFMILMSSFAYLFAHFLVGLQVIASFLVVLDQTVTIITPIALALFPTTGSIFFVIFIALGLGIWFVVKK